MTRRFGPLLRFWRKLVADECPEEKRARIRRERIANILADVAAREALRRWTLEKENGLTFPY